MREYEAVFVLHPSVDESGVEGEIQALTEMIQSSGGTVERVERWGRRRLAYEIQKVHEATYTLIRFQSGTEVLRDMERRFKLNEMMLRHMVVRAEGPPPSEDSGEGEEGSDKESSDQEGKQEKAAPRAYEEGASREKPQDKPAAESPSEVGGEKAEPATEGTDER